MKKKKIANLIMVAIVVTIVAAGIFGAGYIRGWFDTPTAQQAVLCQMKGVTELLRDGVRFTADKDTALRAGDTLFCQAGASARVRAGEDFLVLGENAQVTVLNENIDNLQLQVVSGEVFTHCEGSITLAFESDQVTLSQATALLSVQTGSASIGVLGGTVKDATAGQVICYNDGTATTQSLALSSLNDFTITQIRQLGSTSLCFSLADLDQLAAERQQAIQALVNQQESTATDSQSTQPTTSGAATEPSSAQASDPVTTTEPTSSVQASDPVTVTQPSTQATEATQPAPTGSCTIAIYCHTILNNMNTLDPAKAEFVPSSGTILYPVTVEFTEGETVFDILQRVCSRVGIQLEYSWTPMYNSYYIEGIHQLYEFDCGYESGWMYQVNGWYPNYGCSSYTVKDGDTIVWNYTCQGLGADLGARVN